MFLERLIENIKSGKGALYPNVKEIFTYIKKIIAQYILQVMV